MWVFEASHSITTKQDAILKTHSTSFRTIVLWFDSARLQYYWCLIVFDWLLEFNFKKSLSSFCNQHCALVVKMCKQKPDVSTYLTNKHREIEKKGCHWSTKRQKDYLRLQLKDKDKVTSFPCWCDVVDAVRQSGSTTWFSLGARKKLRKMNFCNYYHQDYHQDYHEDHNDCHW